MKSLIDATLTMLLLAVGGTSLIAQTVVDFEDAVLPGGGVLAANGMDTTLFSRGVSFNADWNETFNCCPGAWAFSNRTDTTTTGFTNPYSAITGAGFGGSSQYGVAFEDVFRTTVPTITLPAGTRPDSIRVTNTTWAFLSMRDGNDGSGFARQFGDDPGNGLGQGNEGFGDFFRLTISGFDELNAPTGSVEFFLADYRAADNADDFVVDTWELVDLSPLADETQRLEFNLESTDVGPFGPNTPFYFAADNLVISNVQDAVVPEPSSLAAALIVALIGLAAALRVRTWPAF